MLRTAFATTNTTRGNVVENCDWLRRLPNILSFLVEGHFGGEIVSFKKESEKDGSWVLSFDKLAS
jgi:hypothetical protein